MNEKCFVIQPFDNDKFDSRYKETYKPAIEAAGFVSYRVDEDKSVRIPIDRIEKEISEASICLADITTDNPNVWYELGYAFACKKDVVMICCKDERKNKIYPFDIRHRTIVEYSNKSKNHYVQLEENITGALVALKKTSNQGLDEKKSQSIQFESDNSQLSKLEKEILKQIGEFPSSPVDIRKILYNTKKYSVKARKETVEALKGKGYIKQTLRTVTSFGIQSKVGHVFFTEKGINWYSALLI